MPMESSPVKTRELLPSRKHNFRRASPSRTSSFLTSDPLQNTEMTLSPLGREGDRFLESLEETEGKGAFTNLIKEDSAVLANVEPSQEYAKDWKVGLSPRRRKNDGEEGAITHRTPHPPVQPRTSEFPPNTTRESHGKGRERGYLESRHAVSTSPDSAAHDENGGGEGKRLVQTEPLPSPYTRRSGRRTEEGSGGKEEKPFLEDTFPTNAAPSESTPLRHKRKNGGDVSTVSANTTTSRPPLHRREEKVTQDISPLPVLPMEKTEVSDSVLDLPWIQEPTPSKDTASGVEVRKRRKRREEKDTNAASPTHRGGKSSSREHKNTAEEGMAEDTVETTDASSTEGQRLPLKTSARPFSRNGRAWKDKEKDRSSNADDLSSRHPPVNTTSRYNSTSNNDWATLSAVLREKKRKSQELTEKKEDEGDSLTEKKEEGYRSHRTKREGKSGEAKKKENRTSSTSQTNTSPSNESGHESKNKRENDNGHAVPTIGYPPLYSRSHPPPPISNSHVVSTLPLSLEVVTPTDPQRQLGDFLSVDGAALTSGNSGKTNHLSTPVWLDDRRVASFDPRENTSRNGDHQEGASSPLLAPSLTPPRRALPLPFAPMLPVENGTSALLTTTTPGRARPSATLESGGRPLLSHQVRDRTASLGTPLHGGRRPTPEEAWLAPPPPLLPPPSLSPGLNQLSLSTFHATPEGQTEESGVLAPIHAISPLFNSRSGRTPSSISSPSNGEFGATGKTPLSHFSPLVKPRLSKGTVFSLARPPSSLGDGVKEDLSHGGGALSFSQMGATSPAAQGGDKFSDSQAQSAPQFTMGSDATFPRGKEKREKSVEGPDNRPNHTRRLPLVLPKRGARGGEREPLQEVAPSLPETQTRTLKSPSLPIPLASSSEEQKEKQESGENKGDASQTLTEALSSLTSNHSCSKDQDKLSHRRPKPVVLVGKARTWAWEKPAVPSVYQQPSNPTRHPPTEGNTADLTRLTESASGPAAHDDGRSSIGRTSALYGSVVDAHSNGSAGDPTSIPLWTTTCSSSLHAANTSLNQTADSVPLKNEPGELIGNVNHSSGGSKNDCKTMEKRRSISSPPAQLGDPRSSTYRFLSSSLRPMESRKKRLSTFSFIASFQGNEDHSTRPQTFPGPKSPVLEGEKREGSGEFSRSSKSVRLGGGEGNDGGGAGGKREGSRRHTPVTPKGFIPSKSFRIPDGLFIDSPKEEEKESTITSATATGSTPAKTRDRSLYHKARLTAESKAMAAKSAATTTKKDPEDGTAGSSPPDLPPWLWSTEHTSTTSIPVTNDAPAGVAGVVEPEPAVDKGTNDTQLPSSHSAISPVTSSPTKEKKKERGAPRLPIKRREAPPLPAPTAAPLPPSSRTTMETTTPATDPALASAAISTTEDVPVEPHAPTILEKPVSLYPTTSQQKSAEVETAPPLLPPEDETGKKKVAPRGRNNLAVARRERKPLLQKQEEEESGEVKEGDTKEEKKKDVEANETTVPQNRDENRYQKRGIRKLQRSRPPLSPPENAFSATASVKISKAAETSVENPPPPPQQQQQPVQTHEEEKQEVGVMQEHAPIANTMPETKKPPLTQEGKFDLSILPEVQGTSAEKDLQLFLQHRKQVLIASNLHPSPPSSPPSVVSSSPPYRKDSDASPSRTLSPRTRGTQEWGNPLCDTTEESYHTSAGSPPSTREGDSLLLPPEQEAFSHPMTALSDAPGMDFRRSSAFSNESEEDRRSPGQTSLRPLSETNRHPSLGSSAMMKDTTQSASAVDPTGEGKASMISTSSPHESRCRREHLRHVLMGCGILFYQLFRHPALLPCGGEMLIAPFCVDENWFSVEVTVYGLCMATRFCSALEILCRNAKTMEGRGMSRPPSQSPSSTSSPVSPNSPLSARGGNRNRSGLHSSASPPPSSHSSGKGMFQRAAHIMKKLTSSHPFETVATATQRQETPRSTLPSPQRTVVEPRSSSFFVLMPFPRVFFPLPDDFLWLAVMSLSSKFYGELTYTSRSLVRRMCSVSAPSKVIFVEQPASVATPTGVGPNSVKRYPASHRNDRISTILKKKTSSYKSKSNRGVTASPVNSLLDMEEVPSPSRYSTALRSSGNYSGKGGATTASKRQRRGMGVERDPPSPPSSRIHSSKVSSRAGSSASNSSRSQPNSIIALTNEEKLSEMEWIVWQVMKYDTFISAQEYREMEAKALSIGSI